MIDRLAEEITAQRLDPPPVVIGIQTGGAWLASRLSQKLGSPLGELNISFYRDDFVRIGLHPKVSPARMPFTTDKQNIILVDDVLYTGRTVRAALNEIFDYGRPASVKLAVLIERNGRELPVQPDFVGLRMDIKANEHLRLNGPDPLSVTLVK